MSSFREMLTLNSKSAIRKVPILLKYVLKVGAGSGKFLKKLRKIESAALRCQSLITREVKMATLVGTQNKFSDALYSLIELHYNAAEAYEAVINKVEKQSYQTKLKEFKKDHEQHAKEFSEILSKRECDVPQGPSFKQWLEIGKVKLATIIGDKQILCRLLKATRMMRITLMSA